MHLRWEATQPPPTHSKPWLHFETGHEREGLEDASLEAKLFNGLLHVSHWLVLGFNLHA
jgi:hypothetical protein